MYIHCSTTTISVPEVSRDKVNYSISGLSNGRGEHAERSTITHHGLKMSLNFSYNSVRAEIHLFHGRGGGGFVRN